MGGRRLATLPSCLLAAAAVATPLAALMIADVRLADGQPSGFLRIDSTNLWDAHRKAGAP